MVVCRRSSCPKKGEFLITSCFKLKHCLEGEKSAYQKLLTVMSSFIFLCSRGINGFAAMHILLLAPFFHEMSKCLQPLNIFFRTTRSVFLEKKICVWRLHFILYVSQLIFGKLSFLWVSQEITLFAWFISPKTCSCHIGNSMVSIGFSIFNRKSQ